MRRALTSGDWVRRSHASVAEASSRSNSRATSTAPSRPASPPIDRPEQRRGELARLLSLLPPHAFVTSEGWEEEEIAAAQERDDQDEAFVEERDGSAGYELALLSSMAMSGATVYDGGPYEPYEPYEPDEEQVASNDVMAGDEPPWLSDARRQLLRLAPASTSTSAGIKRRRTNSASLLQAEEDVRGSAVSALAGGVVTMRDDALLESCPLKPQRRLTMIVARLLLLVLVMLVFPVSLLNVISAGAAAEPPRGRQGGWRRGLRVLTPLSRLRLP